MLVSSSEGFCLDGLVAAILLRAAMIALFWSRSCPWIEGWIQFDEVVWALMIAVGLDNRVERQAFGLGM